MTGLNEKALEAATKAILESAYKDAHPGEVSEQYCRDYAEVAIRAFLTSATPPDVAGLIAELCDAAYRNAGPGGPEQRLEYRAVTALRLSAGGCKTERRKFYHHGYSTAELLKARKSPPEFFTDDGEAWRYEYTHSDGEGGAYDMLYRPASPTVEAGQ